MQESFYRLADFLGEKLEGEELFLLYYEGEDSDFVRFNQSRIRQAGNVSQKSVSIELIDGARHASASTSLSGARAEDEMRLEGLLAQLRMKLPELPPDPHLLYATEALSSEELGENTLPPAEQALQEILAAGVGRDLVGIYAAGGIERGFASSLGQRNWFESYSFNFDWSFYLRADKAVKSGYAGLRWDSQEFGSKVESATTQLAALQREPITVAPGRYRVYLAPQAVKEFLGMLGWGGLGLKSRRTKTSSLLKMLEDGLRLHPQLSILENTAGGVAPRFQEQGFRKPAEVLLIDRGRLAEPLASPRSAKEFGLETNGANADEEPESWDVRPGTIPSAEVLARLDTGIYINNLWYLNYSDRTACRITGMTRFACFWVEQGEIVAPLNVMRFDETLFRAFGEQLIGLTAEREMILDAGTYTGRSTVSANVPGALIEAFNFNL